MADLLSYAAMTAGVKSAETEPSPRFFMNTFFKKRENVSSNLVEYQVTSGRSGLATFRRNGVEAKVVGKLGNDAPVRFEIPKTREKKIITANEIVRAGMVPSSMLIGDSRNPDEVRRDAILRELKDLRERAYQREEWMAAKMFQGGFTYADEAGAFEIDLGWDASYLPVLTGDDRWDITTGTGADIVNTSNIDAQIDTYNRLLIRGKGAPIGTAVLGANAATSFMNHTQVRKNLQQLNYESGRLNNGVGGIGAQLLGRYRNIDWYMYSDYYFDETGTLQETMPLDSAMFIARGIENDAVAYDGIIEEWDENANPPQLVKAQGLFAKSYFTKDPSELWFLVEKRGLPMLKASNGVVFADVQ